MQSLRGEAAKIKAQLMEQRSKQEVQDIQADQLFGVGGREIKQAKGKSGRFSDVHKEQFKKMDSIANHASTWKSKVQGTYISYHNIVKTPHLGSTRPFLGRAYSLRITNKYTDFNTA